MVVPLISGHNCSARQPAARLPGNTTSCVPPTSHPPTPPTAQVENHGSVFKLHYEELLRKDREISDLQAVIQALSLGGSISDAAGGGRRGGGHGGSSAAAGARAREEPRGSAEEGAGAAAAAAGSLQGLLRSRSGGSSGIGAGSPLASLGSDFDDL